MKPCRACDSLIPAGASSCKWCGAAVRTSLPLGKIAASVVLLTAVTAMVVAGLRTGFLPALALGGPESALTLTGTPTLSMAGGATTPEDGRVGMADLQGIGGSPSAAPVPPGGLPMGEEPEAALPDPAAPPPDPLAPLGESWDRGVAISAVYIRGGPSAESEIRGIIPEGGIVLLGDSLGGWREVRLGGVNGWVAERFFSVDAGRPSS